MRGEVEGRKCGLRGYVCEKARLLELETVLQERLKCRYSEGGYAVREDSVSKIFIESNRYEISQTHLQISFSFSADVLERYYLVFIHQPQNLSDHLATGRPFVVNDNPFTPFLDEIQLPKQLDVLPHFR